MAFYDVPVSWVVTKTLRIGASNKKEAEESAYRLWDRSDPDELWIEADNPTKGSNTLDWAIDSIEVHHECIKLSKA